QEAGWLLIDSLVDEIIEGQITPYAGMRRIYWDIFLKMGLKRNEGDTYAGDEAGMAKLYGLYDDLDDLQSAHIPLSKEKSNDELKRELEEAIVEECKRYK